MRTPAISVRPPPRARRVGAPCGRLAGPALLVLAFLVLALGGLAPARLAAQPAPVAFRHLTVDDGLSQGDVTAIVQDPRGFVWFGTEDGLNRYDGHTFRVFKPGAFDTTSLGHPWVVGLAVAGPAGLWVATEGGGLHGYDATTESFTPVHAGGRAPVSEDLFALLQARDGALWVGTRYDGLFRYDPRTRRTTVFRSGPGPNTLGDNRVTALLEDRRGRIWVGTGRGGLSRLDPVTGAWTRYRTDAGRPASLPADGVTALLEDRAGHVWVGTSPGGLARYRPATDNFERLRHDPSDPHTLGHDGVRSLFEDPAGALWVGTSGGLDRLDRTTGRFTRHRHDAADPASLRPGSVLALYLDRSGVFWVGTANGASFFNWSAPPFRHLASRPGDPATLDDPDVWTIYEDRAGTRWVGTSGGLNRIDRATGRVTRYAIGPSGGAGLTGNTVMGLYEDRAGHFWVGTTSGALHRFDRATGRVVERIAADPADPASLRTPSPWHFREDAAGGLWITSSGRGCLSRMDLATRTSRAFCHDAADPNTPAYDIAHDLVPRRAGGYWLGTWGGGFDAFDPATGRFTHHRHDAADRNTVASDFILALHESADGTVWLGTYGAGLDRFDPRTGRFTHYTQATSDLPNDIVLAIEEDARGDVWVSTYRGLARLTPATGRFRSYGLEDGLQALEFNSNASLRSSSGELFFGGVNGVTAFFPDRIRDNPVPPPVVLTGLRVRGQPVEIGRGGPLPQALPFTRALTLQHDQHDVAITFAALHYTDPARNRYRYRLEGYDDAWQEPGPERTATYTNLDPGRYTFRVQAANSDGVWNREGATLALVIAAPPWRTGWAYAAYALLVLGGGVAVARYRRNRLELRHRLEIERVEAVQLRELDHARSRFFANVSHEFRTPLTLTLGPLDDLKAGLYGPLTAPMGEQVDLARRNAGRVLDLINQILDVARLEAGRMRLRARPVDLGRFVRDVARTFVPLAERKAIAFDVHTPEAPAVAYADAEQLEKVVANLLSNALKFTPEGGAVRVTVAADADAVRVRVRDDGPGIPAADLPRVFERFYRVDEQAGRMQPGTGIGLALAREVVDLHGGTIEAESEEGFGSRFTVTLRWGRAHLRPDQVVADDEAARAGGLPEGDHTPRALAADGGEDAWAAARGPAEVVDAGEDVTTVLVVDDNAEVRAYVRRHLVPDYRVLEAADGLEGLAKARALLPDLVLSDVMMPGLDGYAFCRALKADPETDFIPLILLTAKAAPEDRLEGLHEHADDYLTKPFDVAELRARIENLIASRRHLRERFGGAGGNGGASGDGAGGGNGHGALHPDAVAVPSSDAAFLDGVRARVQAHLADDAFSVERLAEGVGVSRAHLHRRLRVLLGQAPSETIRGMRLERAADLLAARAGTVSEVAYAVGFKSVAHFSNAFHARYGCRPSAYRPEA